MIDFPKSTYIHRRMPKEAFYKNITLTAALKEKFVTDVDRIYVENSLTRENLNLDKTAEIKEILLLQIELKKQEFDGKTIEAIARQNPHRLLFILSFKEYRQLALYHGKIHTSSWMKAEELNLKAEGFSLDDIWSKFIEQVALYNEKTKPKKPLTIEERLALQEQIERFEKQIVKIETAAWKEQQPKKRFELYSRMQEYKKQLEELKNGEA